MQFNRLEGKCNMPTMPLISIVTPCYNEESNIEELYARIKRVLSSLSQYSFEIIFIDNNSTDTTVDKIKSLATIDKDVKLIVNTRNFGHIRSPYYGILQSRGKATVYLASDLQDPPELIPEFLRYWEEGYKIVVGVKPVSKGVFWVHALRKLYYRVLDDMSDISLVADSTGFGLYDHEVIDHIKRIGDPYPFWRGLICELGYQIKTISFEQPRRLRGISKNNIYTLYDIAMLGIVSHSKVPIRIAAFVGFALGALSLLVALVYTILKLIFWSSFPLGFAPVVIGLFFLFGVQLMFIGILGEYIGSMHTYLQRRPVVVENERVNFE